MTTTTTNYLTVKQFTEKHPAFPQGGLRNRIFFASTNGLDDYKAIVRNGRRVLINEERFFAWVEKAPLNDGEAP